MTQEQIKLYKLEQLGASEADQKQAAAIQTYISASQELTKTIADRKAKQAELDRQMQDEAKTVYEATRTPLEKYNAELERLSKLLQEQDIDYDTYARAVKQARDQLDQASESTKTMQKAAQDLGYAFNSAFEDAVINGNSFRDVLAGILKDIERIIARRAITEPLGNAISGLFSGGGGFSLTSLFGGGGGSLAAGQSAAGYANLASWSGPSFAVGTPYVPHDMIAKVHKGEAIVPAGQNGGGDTFHINIDARGADAGVEARLKAWAVTEFGPMLSHATKKDTLKTLTRSTFG